MRQPDDETGNRGCHAGDYRGIDGARPAVLWQMEQRIAAHRHGECPVSHRRIGAEHQENATRKCPQRDLTPPRKRPTYPLRGIDVFCKQDR